MSKDECIVQTLIAVVDELLVRIAVLEEIVCLASDVNPQQLQALHGRVRELMAENHEQAVATKH